MLHSSLPRPRFRGVLLGVLLLALGPALAINTATPARAAAPVTPTVSTPSANTRQLADEIVRRLRRLGINFNKTRVSNPYDPDGEIC